MAWLASLLSISEEFGVTADVVLGIVGGRREHLQNRIAAEVVQNSPSPLRYMKPQGVGIQQDRHPRFPIV